jgi:hypothetical protein
MTAALTLFLFKPLKHKIHQDDILRNPVRTSKETLSLKTSGLMLFGETKAVLF